MGRFGDDWSINDLQVDHGFSILVFLNQLIGLYNLDEIVKASMLCLLFAGDDGKLKVDEKHLMDRYSDELGSMIMMNLGAIDGFILWFTFGPMDLQKLIIEDPTGYSLCWRLDDKAMGWCGNAGPCTRLLRVLP